MVFSTSQKVLSCQAESKPEGEDLPWKDKWALGRLFTNAFISVISL